MTEPTVTSGNFTFTLTAIDGAIIVDQRVFGDERGWFMETYKSADFARGGIGCEFVQHNQSHSARGVLRGLHYQKEHPQGKLVRVLSGRIYDVAVDLRPHSASFGRWVGVELSSENRRQFYIPRGCAHGFLALSDEVDFCYLCDDVYRPDDEAGVRWDDPCLSIDWPLAAAGLDAKDLILSDKDKRQPWFADVRSALHTEGRLEGDA